MLKFCLDLSGEHNIRLNHMQHLLLFSSKFSYMISCVTMESGQLISINTSFKREYIIIDLYVIQLVATNSKFSKISKHFSLSVLK